MFGLYPRKQQLGYHAWCRLGGHQRRSAIIFWVEYPPATDTTCIPAVDHKHSLSMKFRNAAKANTPYSSILQFLRIYGRYHYRNLLLVDCLPAQFQQLAISPSQLNLCVGKALPQFAIGMIQIIKVLAPYRLTAAIAQGITVQTIRSVPPILSGKIS